MDGKYIEIKAENVDIAFVIARLSNEEVDKFFSLKSAILEFNL